jgi:hypothetical protein
VRETGPDGIVIRGNSRSFAVNESAVARASAIAGSLAGVIGRRPAMRHVLLLAFLGVTAIALRADPVAELKTALGAFTGRDPVRTTVAFDYRHDGGDEKKPLVETATVSVRADATADGIRLAWPRELIDALAAEQQAHSRDANQPQARQHAVDQLGVTTIAGYLNAAPELARMLEQAELLGAKEETWRGQPARKLTFKLSPPLSEQDRKYVKELDATATVWIDAAGRPLGAEQRMHLKGRALLVISFQSDQREEFRFEPAGDRLVVVEHVKEGSGSGGGQSGKERTAATLTIECGTPL